MLEQLEKYRAELFGIVGMLVAYILGKRKNNSEINNNEADAEKKKAEAESTRIQTILDLQNGLIEIQSAMEDMRRKSEDAFNARELERNAKREETDRILKDLATVKESLATENAKNYGLVEEQRKERQRAFEEKLLLKNEVEELRKEIATHSNEVKEVRAEMVVIKKKTGSLDATGIPDHSKD